MSAAVRHVTPGVTPQVLTLLLLLLLLLHRKRSYPSTTSSNCSCGNQLSLQGSQQLPQALSTAAACAGRCSVTCRTTLTDCCHLNSLVRVCQAGWLCLQAATARLFLLPLLLVVAALVKCSYRAACVLLLLLLLWPLFGRHQLPHPIKQPPTGFQCPSPAGTAATVAPSPTLLCRCHHPPHTCHTSVLSILLCCVLSAGTVNVLS
jgi:hypothetical protein